MLSISDILKSLIYKELTYKIESLIVKKALKSEISFLVKLKLFDIFAIALFF